MRFTLFSQCSLFLSSIFLSSIVSSCRQAVSNPEPIRSIGSTMSGLDHSKMDHSQHPGMSHPRMDLGPADVNYDLRFIDAMTPHHEGAVVMAKDSLQKAKHPELQALAQAILKAQPEEISQMKQWRRDWYPKVTNAPIAWHPEMNQQMPMSIDQMKAMQMSVDLGVADAGYDVRFLDAMIPHHEGAVIMAKNLAKHSTRPEMKQLAKTIIASQQTEIDRMKQWRSAWSKP
jgi:uncharacterized protein (DUF305 family)